MPPDVDCWGLYRLIVGEATGLWLAAFEGVTETMAKARTFRDEELAGSWRRIDIGAHRPLDLVLLKDAATQRLALHCGCVVRPGTMIDIEEKNGVQIRPYQGAAASPQILRRVVGVFRPEALCATA